MFIQRARRRKSVFETLRALPFGAQPRNRNAFETSVRTAGGAIGRRAHAGAASPLPLRNFLVHEIYFWRSPSLAFDQGQVSSGLAAAFGQRGANSKTNLFCRRRISSCLTFSNLYECHFFKDVSLH